MAEPVKWEAKQGGEESSRVSSKDPSFNSLLNGLTMGIISLYTYIDGSKWVNWYKRPSDKWFDKLLVDIINE